MNEAKDPLASDDFYCDEVLSGRCSVEVVEETAEVVAFRHTRPHWPLHIVVVPKQHLPSLTDFGSLDQAAGEELLQAVLRVVRRVAARVEEEHGAARVLTNLGRYQDSKHLHFHVNSGRSYAQ